MSLPAHIDQNWFNRTVRQTDDGKASVLDLIRNATTGRGERRIWADLKKRHPKVEALTDCVRFPDAVGRTHPNRLTPAVDLQSWLQILALLPGVVGDKYREKAADLMVRAWRGDAVLGLQIMLRDANKAAVKHAKTRLRVADINALVTSESMANGERPDYVHDARYRGFYRKRTDQVRREMGLKNKETPLNFLSEGDLCEHEVIQHRALAALKTKGGSLQRHVHRIALTQRESYIHDVGVAPALPHASDAAFMDLKQARAISSSHDAGQLLLGF